MAHFPEKLFLGLYTPFNSFRPRHTRKALVLTELHRLRETCKTSALFHEQVDLFFKLLHKRGYSGSFLSSCLERFCSHTPDQVPATRGRSCLVLVLPFFDKAQHLRSTKCISDILQSAGLDNFKVVTAWKAAPSLFVTRFGRFLAS